MRCKYDPKPLNEPETIQDAINYSNEIAKRKPLYKSLYEWVLLKDVDYFGRTIKAGTIFRQVNGDHYHPIIDGARCPNYGVTFMIVLNNPDYFLKLEKAPVGFIESLPEQNPDIDFLKTILPEHYTVKPSREGTGNIHCFSSTGLRNKKGGDDDYHWEVTKNAIKAFFGDRLSEIYFHTNAFYQNFTVYLKNEDLKN